MTADEDKAAWVKYGRSVAAARAQERRNHDAAYVEYYKAIRPAIAELTRACHAASAEFETVRVSAWKIVVDGRK